MNNLKKCVRSLLVLAIFLTLPVVVLGPLSNPGYAQTKIVYNIFIPRRHPIFTGIITPWAKDVKQATNGRVVVEFPAASMAPPPRQWQMVTSGIADAAMLFNTFERRRLHLPAIAELPFMTPSAKESSIALWRTHVKHFASADEFKGVKLLGLFTTPGNQIHHRSRPISAVSDLNKEKMLAYAGIGKAIFTKLGSVVVAVPAVKSHEVVSKGIVDGVAMSIDAILAFKLIPYLKHTTVVPGAVYNSQFSFFMNEKKWNSISAADQKAILGVSGERIAANAKAWDKVTGIARGLMEKSGAKFINASPQMIGKMRSQLAHLNNDWIERANKRGINGKAAFDYFASQLKNAK